MVGRMLPAIWLRLVVIIGLGIFMLFEGHLIWAAIIGALMLLTIWQLSTAYRQRSGNGET